MTYPMVIWKPFYRKSYSFWLLERYLRLEPARSVRQEILEINVLKNLAPRSLPRAKGQVHLLSYSFKFSLLSRIFIHDLILKFN